MADVRCLHFVCVDDLHVTDRSDGSFSTGYWKIGADAAMKAEKVALHPSRGVPSTRQGTIVERHLLPFEGSQRYLFVVAPDAEPVPWQGVGGGVKS